MHSGLPSRSSSRYRPLSQHKSGLLIRERQAFERAKDLQAVVFDKTGTLTEGRFGVTDILPLGTLTADEVLNLAASLETRSEHPIARGIVTDCSGQASRTGTARELPCNSRERC